jgi:hypothetical protein
MTNKDEPHLVVDVCGDVYVVPEKYFIGLRDRKIELEAIENKEVLRAIVIDWYCIKKKELANKYKA